MPCNLKLWLCPQDTTVSWFPDVIGTNKIHVLSNFLHNFSSFCVFFFFHFLPAGPKFSLAPEHISRSHRLFTRWASVLHVLLLHFYNHKPVTCVSLNQFPRHLVQIHEELSTILWIWAQSTHNICKYVESIVTRTSCKPAITVSSNMNGILFWGLIMWTLMSTHA